MIAQNSSTGSRGSCGRPVRLSKMTLSSEVSSSPTMAIKRTRHASQLSPRRTEANKSGSLSAALMVMTGFISRLLRVERRCP